MGPCTAGVVSTVLEAEQTCRCNAVRRLFPTLQFPSVPALLSGAPGPLLQCRPDPPRLDQLGQHDRRRDPRQDDPEPLCIKETVCRGRSHSVAVFLTGSGIFRPPAEGGRVTSGPLRAG